MGLTTTSEEVFHINFGNHVIPILLHSYDDYEYNSTFAVKPELKDLLKELCPKASDWINIGIFLGIDAWKLDNIRIAENNIPQNCLREMLKIWLMRVSPPPSWAAIAETIEQNPIGDQNLAYQLRTKYHVPPHQN